MTKNGGGFTLFETMITLAVSGVMLVVAITMFGGQQRKTQFAQSMRDLESSISDTMNDVSTGYYPTILQNCTRHPSGRPDFSATPVPVEQGTNLECMFVGKAVHFQESRMIVHSLAGVRLTGTGEPVASYSQSNPSIVENASQTKDYRWGATLHEMYTGNTAVSPPTNSTAFVVFASTVNTTGLIAGSDDYNSGVQRVTPYVSGNTAASSVGLAHMSSVALNNIIGSIDSWPASNKLTLCFEDSPSGPGRLTGGIVIFGGNAPMSVRLQNDSDLPRCT